MEREAEWSILVLSEAISNTISLAAVQLDEKIVVFGGYQSI